MCSPSNAFFFSPQAGSSVVKENAVSMLSLGYYILNVMACHFVIPDNLFKTLHDQFYESVLYYV